MVDTGTAGAAADSFSLDRPDVGQVTREALARGYRLPGAEEGVKPDWYYYRSSATNPADYDLVRKPTAPIDAPSLRARVVGETLTGFVPTQRRAVVEIPHDWTPTEVLDHLHNSRGLGDYAEMLQDQGIASRAVFDRAALTMHELRKLNATPERPVTTDDVRRDVKDYFRERVEARLLDPTLSDAASFARMRSMVEKLAPGDRGSLTEIWYRARNAKTAMPHVPVAVERSGGLNAGKTEGRVIDLMEGKTAIEVKDVKGPIDQEQFGAYMDMLRSRSLKSGTEGSVKIDKVKYVFTNPEGAIANLEFIARKMNEQRVAGRLTVEVFDRRGVRHVVATSEDSLRLLQSLREE
jgi:hypothetical protein